MKGQARRLFSKKIFIIAALATFPLWTRSALAVQLKLTWKDNSTNENGFNIERRVGTTRIFTQLASVTANTTSYTDSSVTAGTTYCYRTSAFNTAGSSVPSGEACGTPTTATTSNLTLTVSKTGSGSGTAGSSPVGISCGADCSESYTSGTVVKLSATPATGSTFVGWSGDADCTDGSVTMTAAKTCTATFTAQQTFALTITKSGSGTVAATGISCGADCSESYASSTVVKLTATPATGSTFAGWSGDADCTDGSVTMTTAKTCTATFKGANNVQIGVYRPQNGTWYLDTNGNGLFDGCTIDSCPSFGTSGDKPVVGDWIGSGQIQLGVFDPATQQWELDRNANDKWEDCAVDICRGPFGLDVIAYPVAGYWKDGNITATAMSLGAFRASVGLWYLDLNNNGRFEISTDLRLGPFGSPTDLPIVGDWTGSGSTKIGTFTPGTGLWHLDRNNNGKFEGCDVDICASPFGKSGDLPVAADWDGVGKDKIGLFESTTGMWKLDLNGNGRFDDCKIDRCMGPFGTTGDLPVVGKW